MSFLQIGFRSDVLQKDVAMNVIVPDGVEPPWPTLYLLHGLSDDASKWHRMTSVERYAQEHGLLVAMPDGFRGAYTNNQAGPRFFDYVVQDVIGQVERLFRVRTDRQGRCVGGLSMGGYGAMLLGLTRPDLFNSVVSHSGALLWGSRPVEDYSGSLDPHEFKRVFGDDPRGTRHDLLHLLRTRLAEKAALPHLRIDCGVDDFLIEDNRAFHKALDDHKVPHEYEEPPGEHNWPYWDRHIRSALAFHARHFS
jgi:S-formylglutathione hydrolase FrmB